MLFDLSLLFRTRVLLLLCFVLSPACGPDDGAARGQKHDAGDDSRNSDGGTDGGEKPGDDAGGSGDDAGGSGDGDSGDGGDGDAPPLEGPPVVVEPLAPTTLFLQEASGKICRIDRMGDLVCRTFNKGSWALLRKGPFVGAASAASHWCAIQTDGAIECWRASGRDHELPLCGDAAPSCINSGVPPAGKYTQVSAGNDFSCALSEAGDIVCWGRNDHDKATPPAGNDFVDLASTGDISCALKMDQSVVCWGDYDFDIDLDAIKTPAKQLEMAALTVCVLSPTGSASCEGWQNQSIGINSAVPLARIAIGGEAMCGLTMQGAIRCSGTPYVERYRAPPGPFVEAVVNSKNVCALRGDDVVECWGDTFGNGAGPESCKVTEAKLTLEGTMLAFRTAKSPWQSGSSSYAGTWRAGTKLESGTHPDVDLSPFVFLLGKGASQAGTGRPSQLLPPDSEVELTQSVWALHATEAGSGDLLCTAPGTNTKIKNNGDELAVALSNVASLGSCPGTPVSGQLAWCGGGSCPSPSLTGDIGGVTWSSTSTQMFNLHDQRDFVAQDGSYLRVVQANGVDKWAILVTAPDGPFGGQVFCVGAVMGDYYKYTFQQLSTLGACPVDGSKSLSGCLR